MKKNLVVILLLAVTVLAFGVPEASAFGWKKCKNVYEKARIKCIEEFPVVVEANKTKLEACLDKEYKGLLECRLDKGRMKPEKGDAKKAKKELQGKLGALDIQRDKCISGCFTKPSEGCAESCEKTLEIATRDLMEDYISLSDKDPKGMEVDHRGDKGAYLSDIENAIVKAVADDDKAYDECGKKPEKERKKCHDTAKKESDKKRSSVKKQLDKEYSRILKEQETGFIASGGGTKNDFKESPAKSVLDETKDQYAKALEGKATTLDSLPDGWKKYGDRLK